MFVHFVVAVLKSLNLIKTMSTQSEPQKTWKGRWTPISDGDGGGQGDVKLVRRTDEDEGQLSFLKILRHQGDPGRRNRMYREVSAYRTLNHPSIPRLLDTNAEEFANPEFKLYLVTEFVEGVSLEKLIEGKGALTIEPSLRLVSKLLAIVEHCHENDTVHRDIKPDNVMVRSGADTEPVLVDFGLSFNQEAENENATLSGEELGNRFLRLPELSASSPTKRDVRSDVTLCAGILLFVLTGKRPSVLVNENRQMPHQRKDVRARLEEENIGGERLNALLTVFDRSFQLELPHRWQTATELRSELELLLNPERAGQVADDALWSRINSYVSQPHVLAVADLSKTLHECLETVQRVGSQLQHRLKGQFALSQTGALDRSAEGVLQTEYSFGRIGRADEPTLWIRFVSEAVGDELLIAATFDNETRTLHRTSVRSPSYGASFEKAIEEVFLKQIARLIA